MAVEMMEVRRSEAASLSRTSSCPSIHSHPSQSLSVPSLRHSTSGSSLRQKDQEVEFLVQQVRQLCHERKNIRKEMDRLDQRCHTEAIELRAQLSAAQARFKATKVERERLRKEVWKAQNAARQSEGVAFGREISFLQSHVESLQTGCSLVADHVVAMKDEVCSFEGRISEVQRWQKEAQTEAEAKVLEQKGAEKELKETQKQIQRCSKEMSEVQQQLKAADAHFEKVKHEVEREAQKAVKRLQVKLKDSMAKDEELREELEEVKARREDLQRQESSLKERLLSKEKELAKLRDLLIQSSPQRLRLPSSELDRGFVPDITGSFTGLPRDTHQRILQEQKDVYQKALKKLEDFQAMMTTPSNHMESLQNHEVTSLISAAKEAEEAAAQKQVQILELSQELELATCKLQLLKDSLLAERTRKEDLSKSLSDLYHSAQHPQPEVTLEETRLVEEVELVSKILVQEEQSVVLRQQRAKKLQALISDKEMQLLRRYSAVRQLQILLLESQVHRGTEDWKSIIRQMSLELSAESLGEAAGTAPRYQCHYDCEKLRQEMESMEEKLREVCGKDGDDLRVTLGAVESFKRNSMDILRLESASEKCTGAVQEVLQCILQCAGPHRKQDLGGAGECLDVQTETFAMLTAVRVAREQAAKEAAGAQIEKARPLDESQLQTLQKHCATSCANIAEISARLSLSTKDTEDEGLQQLLYQEDALLNCTRLHATLAARLCAANERAAEGRHALADRAARRALDARQAAARARRPLEDAIAEATAEIATLQQQLPGEVQRLEEAEAAKLEEEAKLQACAQHDTSAAIRQKLQDLQHRHATMVHVLETKHSEKSEAEIERQKQAETLALLRLEQKELNEAKREKVQQVEQFRFSLWDVEQKITDITEERSVKLRRAETQLQELTRQHSIKMADMKSEKLRELHAIRNSSRSLVKSIAEELEGQELNQALRVHGDLERKSEELLQTASKQLSSVAAAGA